MATAILILVILVVLVNFFALFMSAKRWRIVHVLCTFLVFAASIMFVFLATLSLKTRVSWQKVVQAREGELKKEREAEQTLRYGDMEKNTAVLETSLLGVKAAVEQEQYDRGRIWTNCVPGRFDGRGVSVTTFTPDPAAPPDAPTRANHMVDKMMLYAFKEREANAGDGFKVPYQYLGEFVATGVTESTVNLSPTLPLDPVQLAGLNAPDATWALYEIMPVDRHESFTGFDRETLKLILGTDEKRVLDEYAFDLKPMREIQAIDKDFEPAPELIWFKLKFVKAHSIDVDSTDLPVVDKTLFDSSGRALPLSLRQGEKTSFEIGEFALFDRDSAAQLITDGFCEKVDEIFVRPLHNYENHFKEFDKRFKQIADHVAVVTIDTANLKTANAAAEKQKDYRQAESDKAASDLKSVLYEVAEASKYRLALETELARKRAELSDLYRANNLLVAELAAMQQKIADDLNKPASTPALEPISVPLSD